MHLTDKRATRQHYLTKRRTLTQKTQQNAAKALTQHIQTLDVYQQAEHIALYHAFDAEISLENLWKIAENDGKTCYFPVISKEKGTLLFLPETQKTPQKRNHLDILEPDVHSEHAITLSQIDLMILPLVAFDIYGTRLGRGAGYYDKTLQYEKPGCLMGAAYEMQAHPKLIREPFDIPLDIIVTEQNTYRSTS